MIITTYAMNILKIYRVEYKNVSETIIESVTMLLMYLYRSVGCSNNFRVNRKSGQELVQEQFDTSSLFKKFQGQ